MIEWKNPKTQEQILEILSERQRMVLNVANNLHEVSAPDYSYLMAIHAELESACSMISDDRPMDIIMGTNYVTGERK